MIQIGAWADPLKIGYQDYINMELQVGLADLERVAGRLKLPEVFFLELCTGRSNIFAGCCFRSNDHLYGFMIRHLARAPGIQSISMSNTTKILKREHSFPALPLTAFEDDGTAAELRGTTRRRHMRRRATRASAAARVGGRDGHGGRQIRLQATRVTA